MRLRSVGAPVGNLELDKVDGIPPPNLTKTNIRSTIWGAYFIEKLPPKLIPEYLERELMKSLN
jgi:hypothetical protein